MAADGDAEANAGGDPFVTRLHPVDDRVVGAYDGERFHHFIGNLARHLVPPALDREPVQRRSRVPPPVDLQHGLIRAGRGVKSDPAPHILGGLLQLALIFAGRDERRRADLRVSDRAPGVASTRFDVGQGE